MSDTHALEIFIDSSVIRVNFLDVENDGQRLCSNSPEVCGSGYGIFGQPLRIRQEGRFSLAEEYNE